MDWRAEPRLSGRFDAETPEARFFLHFCKNKRQFRPQMTGGRNA
jgi:hypothetical protein